MKRYIASGIVYGKTWGSGFGAYKAREIGAQSLKDLLIEARKDLKSGALDSGMGFEYLKGALLDIQEIETVKLNGKVFTNSEYTQEFIGDLTEAEQDFLLETRKWKV
jgi:hypothetical protein